MTTTEMRDAQAVRLKTRRGALMLALLLLVQFLDFLDVSIVNVALPSIKHDLGFSAQNLQWVVSGYVLTYGGFLLLGGRAADLLGRRRVFLAGLSVFTVASLASALASGATTLFAVLNIAIGPWKKMADFYINRTFIEFSSMKNSRERYLQT
jgi:MFS family permease